MPPKFFPFFLSLIFLLLTSSTCQVAARDDRLYDSNELFVETDAAGSDDRVLQSKSQIQQQVNNAINKIKKDISNRVKDSNKVKNAYKGQRTKLIGDKRFFVESWLDLKKEHFRDECEDPASNIARIFGVASCMHILFDLFSRAVAASILVAADDLRLMTTELADDYLVKCIDLIAKFEGCKKKLNNEKNKINNYVKKTKYNWSHFKNQDNAIKAQLSNVQKQIKQLRNFKNQLEKIVYGTMCFDIIGATSKIDTPSEREKFLELTRDAMEIACGQVGADADVVVMEIIKQKFLMTRRRDLEANEMDEEPTSSVSLDASSEKDESNRPRLRALRKRATLRIGTLIGIICNCVDEEPVSDVWNSRRKLDTTDEEELDEHLSEEEADHDDNRNLVVHEDAFLSEDRELLGTKLQQKYLQALHESFNKKPLSEVVEVKQISCNGFLSTKEALAYISNLN